MKIAILGFGREGKAVLEFIRKSPKYDFAEIWILDKDSKIKIPNEMKKPFGRLRMRRGKDYLKELSSFNLIFRSPGVPYNLSEIQRAIKKGTVFSSATKLFFENFTGRIIGVTGTKGKGTTSMLIHKILLKSHFDSFLAGNIGKPALEILSQLKQHSIVVLELSSFQLQDLSISPQIAVVLDIFPDHMDAHKDFREYQDAKTNIARYQTSRDKIFYVRDNKFSTQIAKKGNGKKISVSGERFNWFRQVDLKMPGGHNFRNAVMAARVAEILGCLKETIAETAIDFFGLEHRLEFIRILETGDGRRETGKIAFYNDSASTSPQTTIAAIQSFKEPIILIAGGHDKGLDYEPLGKIIRKTSVKSVVLFGENKNKIKKALKRFPALLTDDLKSVIKTAIKQSSLIPNSKFIILFSPGAASFDMFQDYADRGEQFKDLVNKL